MTLNKHSCRDTIPLRESMERAAESVRKHSLKLTKNEHVQGTAVKENKEKYELTEDYVSDKVSPRAIWVIFLI
jgi:hypothetical protein